MVTNNAVTIISFFFILARICSRHFDMNSIEKPMMEKILNMSPKRKRKLKVDAVPTKYLPVIKNNIYFIYLFIYIKKKTIILSRLHIKCLL